MNRIANRLYQLANNKEVKNIIFDKVWTSVEDFIRKTSGYLATGRDKDFNLDDFINADYSEQINLVYEYCQTDDRYKEILDEVYNILNNANIPKNEQDSIISDFNTEVYKEFMGTILDYAEEYGNLN